MRQAMHTRQSTIGERPLPHILDGWMQYSSWSLALSLKQAGADLMTFPEVMFQMREFNMQGLR